MEYYQQTLSGESLDQIGGGLLGQMNRRKKGEMWGKSVPRGADGDGNSRIAR